MVIAVASQPEGPWFESRASGFCAEFACSPRVATCPGCTPPSPHDAGIGSTPRDPQQDKAAENE